ncbi:MAG: AAA family ATPase [Oscillospiraceae bacterium]|nr:AAA family ATPase [Oscillospiraceae bacterium]
MLVDKISLKNFRKYENFEIDFKEKLTVIVGKNQSGKTTILDAVAVALSSYISAVYPYNKKTAVNDKTIIRHAENRTTDIIEDYPCFPLEVYSEGTISSVKYGKEDSMLMAESFDQIIQNVSQVGTDIYRQLKTFSFEGVLPVIVYYSINRKRKNYVNDKNETLPPSRINGYTDCLYAVLESNEMIEWIKKLTYVELQRGEKVATLQAVLDILIKAVKCLYSIDDSQKIIAHYNVENDSICFYFPERNPAIIILDLESDGFKSVIYLVLDIAYRMATLNPQLGEKVIEETDGIVLIDEIDLHLHPEWQQKILGVLTEVFPKVQFIVTTHAPAVINSVKSESLIILEDDIAREPYGEVYGKDVNTIISGIMGVSERPEAVKVLFKDFYKAIDDNNLQKATEILSVIEKEIGNDDTELAGCRVKLSLLKFAGGSDDKNK